MKQISKKVLVTAFMLLGSIYCGSNCSADSEHPLRPNWPSITVGPNNTWAYMDGILLIYGYQNHPIINVEVKYYGVTILNDTFFGNELPTLYNFNGYQTGMYDVIITDDSTIIDSFYFYVF